MWQKTFTGELVIMKIRRKKMLYLNQKNRESLYEQRSTQNFYEKDNLGHLYISFCE